MEGGGGGLLNCVRCSVTREFPLWSHPLPPSLPPFLPFRAALYSFYLKYVDKFDTDPVVHKPVSAANLQRVADPSKWLRKKTKA